MMWICVWWWLVSVCAAGLAGARARELDPGACAARFDVQRDKIIRTEESQEMGARYLSELDVGARHECLRLCCETDACDVFVYEEKSPGSCYLFNCGPPEDFRCKFTAHNNFSSGVLAISRHLAELQDQERLAQHEQDLANLRRSAAVTSATTSPSTSTTRAPAPLAQPAQPAQPAPLAQPAQPAPPAPSAPHTRDPPAASNPQDERALCTMLCAEAARRCSRYQFECHSGGECIAVYNACDGIPQCADGSDEGPELGCPAPLAPSQTSHHLPPPQPSPVPPKTPRPVQQQIPQMLDVSEGAEGGDGRWPPRLAQAQLAAASSRRYSESLSSSPHIFSHKGGLVQEGGGGAGAAQYSPYEPGAAADPALVATSWRARAWPLPPPRPAHHAQSLQPIQTFQIDSSGGEERGWGPEGAEGTGGMVEMDPRRAWPVSAPSRVDQELSMYLPAKTMPEVPVVYTGAQAALRDGPKKGVPLAPRPPPVPVQPAPPAPSVTMAPPPPVEGNRAPEKTTKEKLSPPSEKQRKARPESEGEAAQAQAGAAGRSEQAAHYAQPDDHDGLSEHPPAAVLLLVLGLCMTGVVGFGAACRARAARRRMRRGKPPFAHDADYLVNGMYL